jgi:hypothetical protein
MIVHYCASNDYYGNPQRVYVLVVDGENVAAWDEGYYGYQAVPGFWRDEAYSADRIKCSVTKYKQLLRKLPSPEWAHDVPGYSHLRTLV